MTTFAELELHPALLAALPAKVETPTLVQQLAIPVALAGRDQLTLAQTGSGKTLAFGLPLLQRLSPSVAAVQGLILAPTRELANQIDAALSELATALGLKLVTLTGGVAFEIQHAALAQPPQLIVATPGRLLDLLRSERLKLDELRHLALDEADRLLEMGFWPDIQRLLAFMPEKRQTALFSATLSAELAQLASELLDNPERIEAQAVNSVVAEVEERLYLLNKSSKVNALQSLLLENRWPQVLVFISARDDADALTKKLNRAGVAAVALHGNKEQAQREAALEDFKTGAVRVLVATDLLARGIHIEALPVVINLDLPANASVYVHRIGRTARAGRSGLAISLLCQGELPYWAAIQELTGRALPLAELNGFPLTDLPPSGEAKRPPRDKQANRRSNAKKSIKAFQSKRPAVKP